MHEYYRLDVPLLRRRLHHWSATRTAIPVGSLMRHTSTWVLVYWAWRGIHHLGIDWVLSANRLYMHHVAAWWLLGVVLMTLLGTLTKRHWLAARLETLSRIESGGLSSLVTEGGILLHMLSWGLER